MNQPTAARHAESSAWAGRIEDDALLRGQGRFGDDVKPDGSLAAHFLRSPHALAPLERLHKPPAKKPPPPPFWGPRPTPSPASSASTARRRKCPPAWSRS